MSAIEQIVGYRDIKDELQNLLLITEQPDIFREANLLPPRGFLLVGDEGLGKCFMANQFIADSTRKCFQIEHQSLSDEELSALGDFVDKMDSSGRYLIFIRNIDAIASDSSNALTDILREVKKDTIEYDVFFIGTATDISKVPEDFLNEEPFERTIYVSNPELKDTEVMIEHILNELHVNADIFTDDIAGMMPGTPYHDIKQLISRAALAMKLDSIRYEKKGESNRETEILARHRQRVWNRQLAFRSCTNPIAFTPSFKYFLIDAWNSKEYCRGDYSETDDMQIRLHAAYHEAGHIVVGEVLQPGIIGYASICTMDDASYSGVTVRRHDTSSLMNSAMISLGGTTATRVFLDVIDDGSDDDLKRALRIFRRQVIELGYKGMAHIPYHTDDDSPSNNFRISQENAVYKFADEVMDKTGRLLKENSYFLKQVVDKLMRDGYIFASEIGKIRRDIEEERKIQPDVQSEIQSETHQGQLGEAASKSPSCLSILPIVEQKWLKILLFMKNEFDIMDVSYDTWLASLKPYSIINDRLYIIASEDNDQIRRIIRKKYEDLLSIAVLNVTGLKLFPVFMLKNEIDDIET